MQVHKDRLRVLKEGISKDGPVVYWMSRDQRVPDNWALLYAQEAALDRKTPLLVVFSVAHEFLGATMRQYRFMLKGLGALQERLSALNIPFFLLFGSPDLQITHFIGTNHAALLITDFDPLRIKRTWKEAVCYEVNIPVYEVDAHNIVPCWKASLKQEYGAFTIRPKIRRLLREYLEPFPSVIKHPFSWKGVVRPIDWAAVGCSVTADRNVTEITGLMPGEETATSALMKFIQERLPSYDKDRNDPNKPGQSGLSPYLHFGQLSAQRIALEVDGLNIQSETKAAFVEELIVRRELSDNFCFYSDVYDRFEGFPLWARKSLNEHRDDPRPYLYSLSQFEGGETHDDLWNACQLEMVMRGKMHGYLRMYWAKKILEWTASPEEAIEIAIYLNDKYELDGRDPNGYTGIAWAIGGVHDRPWATRKVFGSVRYMSYNGCKTKFDVKKYIDYAHSL
jgi:deoxyribodipyrimidine photo-lyase